jgi:hypothetical protein
LIYGYDRSTDYQGAPCLSDNGTARFLRDEKRRAREIQDFLALGRLLVVLVPPPQVFYVATGETRNEGTAAKPRIRRIVTRRSLSDLFPGNATFTDASGTSVQLTGSSSFPGFWKAVGDQFNYVATIEGLDTPLLSIKGTNHTVAGLLSVNGGQVLLLPERYTYGPSDKFAEEVEGKDDSDELWDAEQRRIDKEVDGEFLDALFEFADSLIDGPSDSLPAWSERFLLPEEAKAAQAVEKAAAASEAALECVEQARLKLVEIRDWKRLLSGTGSELERSVGKAFQFLGCEVEEGPPGRADLVVRWKRRTAVVEVKGLTKSAAESHAAQLEKWVSEHTVEFETQPKGILVANAWRSAPLDERSKPTFPNQMLAYSEKRDHCLLSTTQLLAAVVSGTSIKKREAFLKELFETSGVLDSWDWSDSIAAVSDTLGEDG